MKHPKEEYKGTGSGWCPVPYCKEGAKWFMCICGRTTCANHHIFTLRPRHLPIEDCYFCRPDLWDRRGRFTYGMEEQ